MTSRTQLTLFVTGDIAAEVEAILIAAHVTLCREDELEGLTADIIEQRLSAAKATSIALTFGSPQPFGTHGILLPCINNESSFHALRRTILSTHEINHQVPHITLAHPRNPKFAGDSLSTALALKHGMVFRFTAICRVEQHGRSRWTIKNRFELCQPSAADTEPI
jgi:2'-5' RNA ligase